VLRLIYNLCFFFILFLRRFLILNLVELLLLKLLPSDSPLMDLLELGIEPRLAINSIILVRIDYVLVGILRVIVISDAFSTHIRLRRQVHWRHRVAIHVKSRRMTHRTIIAAVWSRWASSAIGVLIMWRRHIPVTLIWSLWMGVRSSLIRVSRVAMGRSYIRVSMIEGWMLRHRVIAISAICLTRIVITMTTIVRSRILAI